MDENSSFKQIWEEIEKKNTTLQILITANESKLSNVEDNLTKLMNIKKENEEKLEILNNSNEKQKSEEKDILEQKEKLTLKISTLSKKENNIKEIIRIQENRQEQLIKENEKCEKQLNDNEKILDKYLQYNNKNNDQIKYDPNKLIESKFFKNISNYDDIITSIKKILKSENETENKNEILQIAEYLLFLKIRQLHIKIKDLNDSKNNLILSLLKQIYKYKNKIKNESFNNSDFINKDYYDYYSNLKPKNIIKLESLDPKKRTDVKILNNFYKIFIGIELFIKNQLDNEQRNKIKHLKLRQLRQSINTNPDLQQKFENQINEINNINKEIENCEEELNKYLNFIK